MKNVSATSTTSLGIPWFALGLGGLTYYLSNSITLAIGVALGFQIAVVLIVLAVIAVVAYFATR